MTDNEAAKSYAQQRRREASREEWREQTRLAEFLHELIDPATTFWTSLENKPLSQLSGVFQKLRGVRSGIPDVLVFFRLPDGSVRIVFVELKSRSGTASKTQKQTRLAMLPAGAVWYLARSAAAALQALHLAGVVFRRPWQEPRLQPWEGPFADPHRLPQAPEAAARRRIASQKSRQRQRARCEAERAALAASAPAGAMPKAKRVRHDVERIQEHAAVAEAMLTGVAPRAARAMRDEAAIALAQAERKAAYARLSAQRSALAGAARRAARSRREAELVALPASAQDARRMARTRRAAELATPADAPPDMARRRAS
jgi:hypothetical protein